MNNWLSLEEFKRKYGHMVGDLWVPRVTAITEIVAKPGLLRYYAAQENFAAAQRKLRNSANWGTLTHQTIEEILKGKKPEIHPKILPSIEAFLEWKSQHQIIVLDPERDIEKFVFHPEQLYAGRMDALVEIDGVLGILDIKTGTGIWEEYFLQTAAYLEAYNNIVPEKEKAKTRWIVRVDQYQECSICGAKKREKSGEGVIKGGNPFCQHHFGEPKGFVEFKELPDSENDISAFLHAKNLWEWYHREYLKQIKNYPKFK
ncbi:hypothetical protein J7K92_00440 [bacterium]|nr:hypothetical protein [bacterium]